MIRETFKLEGKTQIDVTQHIAIPREIENLVYRVDTYFFLPGELLINEHTYSGTDFQKGLKNYIRLGGKPRPMKSLLGKGGAMDELRTDIAIISGNERMPENYRRIEYESAVKRFAIIYERSLKAANAKLIESIETIDAKTLRETYELAQDARTAYRELAEDIALLEQKLGTRAFAFCDEYMSVSTANKMTELYEQLPLSLMPVLDSYWLKEKVYRDQHYPLATAHYPRDKERLLYRWRGIRKYVNSLLFLDAKYENGTPILLHSLYGVAAALSMIFATVIAFAWQGKYGSLSIDLFIALIIAYIFKDRIKEVSRAKLARIFRKWIPDRRLNFYRGGEQTVGSCHESFDFIRPEDLQRDVRQFRDDARQIPFLNEGRTENIFRYRKQVTLKADEQLFKRTSYNIVDITRFNMADFLRNIDNLYSELPTLELNEPDNAPVAKTYHIYMARRITLGDKSAVDLTRLSVSAEGIRRWEVLVSAIPI